jgi:hypothetical protein
MNTVPEYVKQFIEFNKETLKDIFEAGCTAETEGLLMIEIELEKNDSKVYFVGKQRLIDMGKEELYNDIKLQITEDKKDDMILYIMDRHTNKVHLLIVNKK